MTVLQLMRLVTYTLAMVCGVLIGAYLYLTAFMAALGTLL